MIYEIYSNMFWMIKHLSVVLEYSHKAQTVWSLASAICFSSILRIIQANHVRRKHILLPMHYSNILHMSFILEGDVYIYMYIYNIKKILSSLWHKYATWWHISGSGNGLLLDGTRTFSDPNLTWFCVTFTPKHFYKKKELAYVLRIHI